MRTGVGPALFRGMLLADLGAEVIRIDRTGKLGLGVDFPTRYDLLGRIGITGALDAIGPEGAPPTIPLNLVGYPGAPRAYGLTVGWSM